MKQGRFAKVSRTVIALATFLFMLGALFGCSGKVENSSAQESPTKSFAWAASITRV